MKNLFIPYKLAKAAHHKGFPNQTGSCLAAWEITDNAEWLHFGAHPVGLLQAPLYGQIVDWFREKHDIEIRVDISAGFVFWVKAISSGAILKRGEGYTYYKTLDKAIEEAFKLI